MLTRPPDSSARRAQQPVRAGGGKIIGYCDLATLVVAIERDHDSRRRTGAVHRPTEEAAIVLTKLTITQDRPDGFERELLGLLVRGSP